MEGEQAVLMYPVSKDAVLGPTRLADLAQIYAKVGEKQKAVTTLARVLSLPFGLTVHSLRADPAWDRLRGDPSFETLLRRGS